MKDGDITGLQRLLAADAQLVGDSGGKAPQLAKTVNGAQNVARLLAAFFPWLSRIGVTAEPHDVNGEPGAIVRAPDGRVLHVLAFEMLDGRISTIRSLVNPDKLAHLGPVADAWAITREIREARRAAR